MKWVVSELLFNYLMEVDNFVLLGRIKVMKGGDNYAMEKSSARLYRWKLSCYHYG